MKYNLKFTAFFMATILLCLLSFTNLSYAADESGSSHVDHHKHMGGHMHMQHGSDDAGMDPNSERFANAKKIADKACSDCHGKEGISKTDDNPNLAGQDALYFCKTMYDYRSRARNLPPIKNDDGLYVPTMNEVVDKLSDQDIVDLSEYYAHLRAH
jgi:cytochrome c553